MIKVEYKFRTNNIYKIYYGYWYNTTNELAVFGSNINQNELPVAIATKNIDLEFINILTEVEKKAHTISYIGHSLCRLCSCLNGTDEFYIKIGDTIHHWPVGLQHYFKNHGVQIPTDFRIFIESIV